MLTTNQQTQSVKTLPREIVIHLSDPSHGVETRILMQCRKSNLLRTVIVIYDTDLRPCEMRQALDQALGDRWQYKLIGIKSFPYEF